MRDAEDLTKNSAADMAAIFGVRSDVYSLDPTPPPPLRVNPKMRTTLSGVGDSGVAFTKQKRRRRDKNREDNYSSSGSATKYKNKKRKHVSE